MFERHDWTLFRNLGTLCQKAGVPQRHLRRLVVKELVDNALDCGAGEVTCGKTDRDTYWVQDNGSGIPGDAHSIARLFSVARPMASTKVLRLPVRGALGNGLRVVVGAVLATGGTLEVTTRGVRYTLCPQDDGSTHVVNQVPVSTSSHLPSAPNGTRVTVFFGPGLPTDSEDLYWGNLAKMFRSEKAYKGKTCPWWYDSDSFYELFQAAGELPLAELIENFQGFGLARKDQSVADFLLPILPAGMACNRIVRDDSERLLKALREVCTPIPPGRIGQVGKDGWHGAGYAKDVGVLHVRPGRGKQQAEIPYVVECWALRNEDGKDQMVAYVNGTPITGEMRVDRHKPTKVAVFGCGMSHYVESVSKQNFTVLLNVTTPYMPITTDGKEPDFSRYLGPLQMVISRATRKLKSAIRKADNHSSQQEIILSSLPAAIAQASGSGHYRYSLRQLYYAVRPFVLADGGGRELNYEYFARVITSREADEGELPGMYRDPRGTLYHPHLGRSIPLGTLAVENYERPPWTFNKILYLEKEGFSHLLQSTGWPERNDCAILSSKGFASRAVRDVLDLLGDTDEEIQFFCVHDADASGTLIYQALQEGTRARHARKFKIINLGLEPWEALEMGLEMERFDVKGGRRLPVANYVHDASLSGIAAPEDAGIEDWYAWLQGRRVELNAMTSPQFLAWLDDKMKKHDRGKVIPPLDVLSQQLRVDAEAAIRRRLLTELANAHDLDGKVSQAMSATFEQLSSDGLRDRIAAGLAEKTSANWREPLRNHAEAIAGGMGSE